MRSPSPTPDRRQALSEAIGKYVEWIEGLCGGYAMLFGFLILCAAGVVTFVCEIVSIRHHGVVD